MWTLIACCSWCVSSPESQQDQAHLLHDSPPPSYSHRRMSPPPAPRLDPHQESQRLLSILRTTEDRLIHIPSALADAKSHHPLVHLAKQPPFPATTTTHPTLLLTPRPVKHTSHPNTHDITQALHTLDKNGLNTLDRELMQRCTDHIQRVVHGLAIKDASDVVVSLTFPGHASWESTLSSDEDHDD